MGCRCDVPRSLPPAAPLADLHATLALVAEMVMLRDRATGGHLRRVAEYCGLIASALERKLPLPLGYGALLASFAPLHDVGKVGIPDRILLKPAGLDPEEQRIMRSHVVLGMALIERVLEVLHLGEEPAVQVLREVVAHHHEALDGSGYPRGLRGEEVSLAGRIVAVADIYDSLTQERPYKTAQSDAEALTILRGMVEAGKLDGRCLEALESCDQERAAIRRSVGGGGPGDGR